MLKLRRGNLLEANTEALVNTVNCVGVMGKGVALQFKQAFPENYRQYERACRAGAVQPGTMLTVRNDGLGNPNYIINFPTKRHWKGKSRIEDIKAGLLALIAEVQRLSIQSVAVPPLGCGNGGLDWDDIRPLIQAAFRAVPNVEVILFEPTGAPNPSKLVVATTVPAMTRGRALLLSLLEGYRRLDYPSTLLEVQKLAYFLQVAGEPLQLKYVKQKYGPYAEALNHVLQRIDGHYIRGYGDRSREAQITLQLTASEKAHAFLQGDPQALEHLDRVAKLIVGFETRHGMELLATVHWVATQENGAAATDPDQAIASVHAWSDHKKTFRVEHIRKAWTRLSEQGWLVPEALTSILT